ncbi:MAG: DUF3267 domain-containing protein [Brevefilum sp.]
MESSRPTQTLPDGYQEIGMLDFNDNRGLGMILNLVGLGLLFGVGWLLTRSLSFLRPAYLSAENILIITGMREFWRGVLLMVVSLGLMIVLNEGMRGIMLWVVTRQRPKIGFHGFYTYTSAPGWYIPRNTAIAIRLTPLVLITVVGVALVPIVPLNLIPGVLLLVSLNIASAVGDGVTIWWLYRKPKSALVQDDGDSARVFND